jgi:hypothetical protein
MYLWTDVSPDYCNRISRRVMQHWICHSKVIPINYYTQVLNSQEGQDKIRKNFSSKSDGIFSGCIGALDGWLVRIRCPKLSEVDNPGKYFSRKGFFAINVQVIVDKNKRVLWRYIGEKGSSHDSLVFNESKLGRNLVDLASELRAKGLYIVGDSAYAIRSYLLTPYDGAQPNSKEDAFNFFLSSMRIYVECTFGEVDRRWGILWRPLEGNLAQHKYTIDSCLKLHNFIVDFREEGCIHNESAAVGKPRFYEMDELNVATDQFMINNPFGMVGVFEEEDDQTIAQAGRRTNKETIMRERGKKLRENICLILFQRGLSRPRTDPTISRRDRHHRTVLV